MILVTAIVLGGGGSPGALQELTVQLIALGGFGLAVIGGARPLGLLRQDRCLGLFIVSVLAFPLIQLMPMPPDWWVLLPGRDTALAAVEATGMGATWRPWSLLPDNTAAAALALLVPVAMALLIARLPVAERVRLVTLLALAGLVAALVGVVQFIRGADHPLSLYPDVHRGWGVGFFANRNAQADLLAIALIAAVLLIDRWRGQLSTRPARAGAALAVLLLLIGGVATGSRMGLAMFVIPVLLALFLAGRSAPGLVAVLAGGAAVLLVGGTALDRVTARVHDGGSRAEIWGDSLFLARAVAPVGAGMGSFVPLYAAAERLDHVQPTIANRAHNDWLELAIEGGVPALMLLATLLVFVAVRAVKGWRDPDPDRRLLARFAGLTTLVFAAHSTVDYPLRTLTLLTVAGLALGGLALRDVRPHGA